jgi:hypothetical protein
MYAAVFKGGIAKRKDVSPSEGEQQYGDVAYADPTNKKYPIDTEEHIRAAWNYINKEVDAAKYSADDVSAMKAKIVAAWKKTIDKAGPPSAAQKQESAMYAGVFKGYGQTTPPKKDPDAAADAAGGNDHDEDDTTAAAGSKKAKTMPGVMKEEKPMVLKPVAAYKHEKVRSLGSVASAMGICN